MSDDNSKIGAAILGLYAAIAICDEEGYPVEDILAMVKRHMEDWGQIKKSKDYSKNPLPNRPGQYEGRKRRG